MNLKSTRVFLGGLMAALMLCAAFAGTAMAGPQWEFDSEPLSGEETIMGAAEESSMNIIGMETTCENFLYEIDIDNAGGTGGGDVEDLPLFNCYTDTVCTVDGIEGESFPWDASLESTGGKDYVVIEEAQVSVVYGNPECAFYELEVEVTGSAGGRLDNGEESATFDDSSFEATGTGLEVFGTEVDWDGVFPAEAFEWHREEALTVS